MSAGQKRPATLVIGGGGFIGGALLPLLCDTGRQVTVLGRQPAAGRDLPAGANWVQGDFGNLDLLRSLLQEHAEVIHLAYATVPNTSFSDPLADLLQNLPPTVQLFAEIAARGGRLVLVSSGGTVYGEAMQLPIEETHPVRPISPYGVTKMTLENYAYLFSRTHGLQYVCVRPGNPFGIGQRPFVGQGFISTAMASIMQGRPVKIFGRQGTIRDYLYVSDVASGIMAALLDGRDAETYNIGSGIGRSNLEVIRALTPLMEEIGCRVDIEHGDERVFDVRANVLCADKLRRDTGWSPAIGFEAGLRLTRDWLRRMA